MLVYRTLIRQPRLRGVTEARGLRTISDLRAEGNASGYRIRVGIPPADSRCHKSRCHRAGRFHPPRRVPQGPVPQEPLPQEPLPHRGRGQNRG